MPEYAVIRHGSTWRVLGPGRFTDPGRAREFADTLKPRAVVVRLVPVYCSACGAEGPCGCDDKQQR